MPKALGSICLLMILSLTFHFAHSEDVDCNTIPTPNLEKAYKQKSCSELQDLTTLHCKHPQYVTQETVKAESCSMNDVVTAQSWLANPTNTKNVPVASSIYEQMVKAKSRASDLQYSACQQTYNLCRDTCKEQQVEICDKGSAHDPHKDAKTPSTNTEGLRQLSVQGAHDQLLSGSQAIQNVIDKSKSGTFQYQKMDAVGLVPTQ